MTLDRDSHGLPQGFRELLGEVATSYAQLGRSMLAGLDVVGGDEVMELAEMATLETLARLPLSPVYCPFCTVHTDREGCQGCEYAAEYGVCTEPGSVFDQALTAHYALVGAIQNFDRGRVHTPLSDDPGLSDDVRVILQEHAHWMTDLAKRFESEVQEADFAEDMMDLRQDFMIELVRELPMETVCDRCGAEHSDISEAKDDSIECLERCWEGDLVTA